MAHSASHIVYISDTDLIEHLATLNMNNSQSFSSRSFTFYHFHPLFNQDRLHGEKTKTKKQSESNFYSNFG